MELFGYTEKGQAVHTVTLTNRAGTEIAVMDLGATLVAVRTADREGKLRDVLLGYDSPAEYQAGDCYFGALVGRNANRIEGARLNIGGREILLEANENGVTSLHSGSHGFSREMWTIVKEERESVTLFLHSPDGYQDFPGNMDIRVTYRLDENNALSVLYDAESDADTVANFTSHGYFNLDGQGSGPIDRQQLRISAACYTPVRAGSIPTGEIAPVQGTPMDFREFHPLGERAGEDFEQLVLENGYDHNYVLDDTLPEETWEGLRFAAEAKAAESGIRMRVYTDRPGLQLYCGYYIGEQKGKDGAVYGPHSGFALETQYFPNAVNEPDFPSPILRAGEHFHSRTVYRFLTDQVLPGPRK